ncbi:MAG: tetratricopeptide repeat protein, partial [Candidatus Thorarchaeota archaeon]
MPYERTESCEAVFRECNSLFENQEFQEALTCYNRYTTICPGDPMGWNNHGACLIALGRYLEAVHSCNMALELEPNHKYANNNKGQALEAAGKLKEAAECYMQACRA